MPIQVVCPGCKTRFNVSDKYAGQKGPCPKCKDVIQIPSIAAEDVKVHAPVESGPKDSKGRSVLKPIERRETKFSPIVIAIVTAGALLSFAATFAIGHVYRDAEGGPPVAILAVGLLLASPPVVVGGYGFLQNEELEAYSGAAKWIRAAICGIVFAALWGAFMFIPPGYLGENPWSWPFIALPFFAVGGLTALATLDLDFGSGIFLYAFYLAVTMALRFAVGLEFIWSAVAA